MLTIVIYLKEGTIYTYTNVVDFSIKELTYVQYQIMIYYSMMYPESKEELIIDKDNLVNISIH